MKQKTNVTSLPKKNSKTDKDDKSQVSSLSPREIVSELDRYVIGQKVAKKAKNTLNTKAAKTPHIMICFLFLGAKFAATIPMIMALSAAITMSMNTI